MTYEEVGKLAYAYFMAEEERVRCRIERAKVRDAHNCILEYEYCEDDTGAHASFCWRSGMKGQTPFEEWCDNCKFVQPYHERYIAAARKAGAVRHQLSRKIKARIEAMP